MLCLKGPSAGQHVEPLRAHKYPIPKEAHCGVQIKVSLSRASSELHYSPQQLAV